MPLVSVRDAGDKKIIFYMDLERYRFGQLRDGYLECIQRLVDQSLRCDANIIVETASARDPHHFAVLLGFGAVSYTHLSNPGRSRDFCRRQH